MKRRQLSSLGAVLIVALVGLSPARAQTRFQNYLCADGTQFIAGFFEYDKRAHLQIDGKAVTLAKRVALSGARYSGGGIALKISNSGTPLKRRRKPVPSRQLTESSQRSCLDSAMAAS